MAVSESESEEHDATPELKISENSCEEHEYILD
jgi:hypothetical protein